MRYVALVAAVVAGTVVGTVRAASFADDFSGAGVDPAWVTDRYAAPVLNTAGGTLNIGTNDTAAEPNRGASYNSDFYNTQGIQRSVGGTGSVWTVSGDLFVGSQFAGPTKMRTDLWARDNNASEASAQYPIIGVTNGDPTDAYGNAAVAPRFRVWDGDTANGWVDLGAVTTLDKWYNLSITSTGSSFEFRIDGSLVYTDNTYSAAGAEDLRTVFVEVFNFNKAGAQGADDYAVQWDHVNAGAGTPVPLPASAWGGVALLGLLAAGKRLMPRKAMA